MLFHVIKFEIDKISLLIYVTRYVMKDMYRMQKKDQINHFEAVGNLGLASRLRRFSDYLMGEAKIIYKERNIDFDPTWFPLFSLLLKVKKIGITQAAGALGYSHPHIIKIARQMEKKMYVASKPSANDARSRELCLTPAGLRLAKELRPVWKKIQRCVDSSVQAIGADLTQMVQKTEAYFTQSSFSERMNVLDRQTKIKGVQIVAYDETLKWEFERLNRQWLEKYFMVEPSDEEAFLNPAKKIIEPGGQIIFAKAGNRIAGTCALIKEEESLQIGRMAVDEEFRGRGVGNLLMEEILKQALDMSKKNKIKKIYLHSNTRLRPAIALYQKFGFVITHEGQHPKYIRGNLIMEYQFNEKEGAKK